MAYGCTIEQATFVPPSPLQLQDFLERWETYIAGDDIDTLIQCAVVHAQFELIHPFKDGNGRIGRLLIPLFLYQKKALKSPMFYVSEYMESNREEYYSRLKGISRDGDWTAWVEFFLAAVESQSESNTDRVRGILNLYEVMKGRIMDLTRSQYSLKVLDALFDRPIFEASDFVVRSGVPKKSVQQFLKVLKDAEILKVLRDGSGRKPAILAFAELLNCAEGRKVL